MIITNRFVGEEIQIGDDIVVKILSIHPTKKKVRLGITTPKNIGISYPYNKKENH